jgi:transcriptional regulator with XRE-family HTH domain
VNSDFDELLSGLRATRDLPPPDEARRIRESAGVSMNRLACALAVHRSTLSRWERGLTVPAVSSRPRYAAALRTLSSGVSR